MATSVPPPSKKQRVELSERARNLQSIDKIPKDAGSLRIQFYDETSGLPIGAPTQVPVVDANPKNLELLVNSLRKNDPSEYIPYRFNIPVKDKTRPNDKTSVAYPTNIWKTLISPGLINTEEIQNISAAPQTIFKVQAVSRCTSAISGHCEAILATQFSPASSSRMLSGSGDNTARIWDCLTGTPFHTLKGHTSWVLAVSWSPDEMRVATGSMDNTVRLWDPKSGKQVGNVMTGHSKWVTSLSWEPYHAQEIGQPRVASSSKDATVRVWLTNQQKIVFVLSGHKGSVSCVKWGGLGHIYTASHDKTVKVWNSKDGTLAHTLNSHAHWVNHLALSTDFVNRTGYHDYYGRVPDSDDAKLAKSKERFLKATTVQGKLVERLVSASDDFTMYLWDISMGNKPITRMVGHQKQVNYVTFSPDGLLIASSGFDNHTKLWNGRDGKFINTLRGHVAPVYQCAFSPDSRLLVSGSKDTTLKVWDMRTHKLLVDLPGHKDEVYAVDWSPDGQKVGSGGKDKAVRIWCH